MLATLGHDGPPTNLYTRNAVSGELLDRCPVRTLQLADQRLVAEMARMKRVVRPMWKQGTLPAPGNLGEQSARVMAWMELLDEIDAGQQAKYAEIKRRESAG